MYTSRIEYRDQKRNYTCTVNQSLAKVTKTHNVERIISSINSIEKTGYPEGKKMKVDSYLIPLTKNTTKWIKDLNIKPKPIKLLETNIGKRLVAGLGNDFFWIRNQKHRQQKLT